MADAPFTTRQVTARQAQVVALLRRGDTNKEIAAQLGITPDAVKAHLSRLYLRFDVSNRVALLSALASHDDRALTESGDLGELRSIAGRLRRSSTDERDRHSATSQDPLDSLRRALAAVDAALDLVRELPDETKGQVIDAVRRRLSSGFAALDELQRSLATAPRSA